jgi:Pyridine nucleotide-disulphide oxidoreductase, dimerisation domain
MGSVQCSTKRPLKAPSPAAMRPSSLTYGKPSGARPLRSCSRTRRSRLLARPHPTPWVVGSNSYADQGRAKVEARNVGVVRVYANRDRGVIKGACLFGPSMDHIAHLFAWAIERSETASALLQLPFYHPMFEEGLKTALREICEAVGSPELRIWISWRLPVLERPSSI